PGERRHDGRGPARAVRRDEGVELGQPRAGQRGAGVLHRHQDRAARGLSMFFPAALDVIDSHTEGEPTRVVTAGWPELRAADMAGRRTELLREWDHLRSAVVCEPRGHDAVVGALLTPPI